MSTTIIDKDGNTYDTVNIGSQIWMSDNLIVSTFRNGDPIQEVKTIDEWLAAGIEKKTAWCDYEDKQVFRNVYGKLYNWYAVIDPRGLAPEGWHIPSSDEFEILFNNLGGSNYVASDILFQSSGFHAKVDIDKCNYRSENGIFRNIGSISYWSSTESAEDYGYDLNISINGIACLGNCNKKGGISVRCLQNPI